ncbi:ATP-NAD kinase family protein [Halorubrum vacuolatum]|uniref:Predicted polyphosphate- or ATP-dependent NAD kinase n=1 Tax=Halorubrum vacuolatum TaxID=63740 RepID=A0A238WX50_HALVU|nr:ATP-NAD kinase family protein [Halorubrum vacuolatum]SNR50169.1 Predicted polyphosphate- or ATP-dependent NAD kinase [Halorubrum vacuolatum]
MHIGFVMNPIAGMGGRVGLKGTDGKVAEAIDRGAEPRAPDRARRALARLATIRPDVEVTAAADPMGASLVREAGITLAGVIDSGTGDQSSEPTEPNDRVEATESHEAPETTAEHTKRAVRGFLDRGVDLVWFVGGDGTAADVAEALEGTDTPMLGVPAGVKVYSSVFAVSPEDAAEVVASFSRTERREVMDIDEDEYRAGEVHPELRAVAHVPVAEDLQSSKQLGGGTVESLAEGVATDIRAGTGVTYVLGPGSTVGAIKAELGFEPSPIGVDVWRDGEVIVQDATEREILDSLGEENVIVVSPIGGQGFVFGRGNPQLSPAVIRECDVRIVASRAKLDAVRVLRVDTDDPELDAELAGWVKVRVGKFERRMMKIA